MLNKTTTLFAALLLLLPSYEVDAKGPHFTPPGHAKHHYHEGKHKYKHKHKHKKKYKHKRTKVVHVHHYHDSYHERRKKWRKGHRIRHDIYRHGRVLRRDRHGHLVVDFNGDVVRLLANSLEIIEIISRR